MLPSSRLLFPHSLVVRLLSPPPACIGLTPAFAASLPLCAFLFFLYSRAFLARLSSDARAPFLASFSFYSRTPARLVASLLPLPCFLASPSLLLLLAPVRPAAPSICPSLSLSSRLPFSTLLSFLQPCSPRSLPPVFPPALLRACAPAFPDGLPLPLFLFARASFL